MGISIWQLLIVLAIVVLLFGTTRLKNIGGDLGSAIRGFKKAVNDDEPEKLESPQTEQKEALKDSDKPGAEKKDSINHKN